MEYFKYYFGNLSEFIQALGTLAAFIAVSIAYLQLRNENKKRDAELKNVKEQTQELRNLYELQLNIRRNEIKPSFIPGGSSSSSEGYSFYFINIGKRAYDLKLEIVKQHDNLIILPGSDTKILESGKSIVIKVRTKDNTYGYDKLKDTILTFNFYYYDEDRNYYRQPAEIKDGKQFAGFQMLNVSND